MKKIVFISILAIILLFSACSAGNASVSSENELSEQQQKFILACSLIDEGNYDEAEIILSALKDFQGANEKLREIQQIKQQLELQNSYAGLWAKSDFSGQDLFLSTDGTGTYKRGDDLLTFSYIASDSDISTDLEEFPTLQLNTFDNVRSLTAIGVEFFCDADIASLPEPERIEITAENWDDYFEIVTECFAKSLSADGEPDYYAEILYFLPKADTRERMSPYHQFELLFSVDYFKNLYYINVDHETFMPLDIEKTTPEPLGNFKGECVLNNQSLTRIETGAIVYSDGFAHQSLRPFSYGQYSRYYDIAENISVNSVVGCIFLTDNGK